MEFKIIYRIALGLSVLTILLNIVVFNNTKKEYKIKEDNITKEEYNTLSMYLIDGEEETPIDTTPDASKYEIDTNKSYCKRGDQELHDVLTTINNNFVFKELHTNDKCYLYFSKVIPAADKTLKALKLNLNKSPVDFDKTSCATGCEEATNGVFKGEEGGQPTYYFRGSVSNNYVLFANMYWRIIRINGDGSIRMIYSGTTAGATGKATQLNNGATQTFSKDAKYDDNAYVGYKYGSTGQTQNLNGYNATHTNTHDSGIKSYIDTWYTNNLKNTKVNGKNASEYIDTEAGFCGDRTPYQYSGVSATSQPNKNSYGAGKTQTYYGAYIRTIQSPRKPIFDCQESNDLYTLSGATTGNHALTNPIGLITADEVNFAGGRNTNNTNYWLYTGEQGYWTMSPYCFFNGIAQVFYVYSNGLLTDDYVDNAYGVRPVINLKADTKFTFTDSGAATTGTSTNPYKVS